MTAPVGVFREEPGALLVSVRLTPRGGRDGLDGFEALANGTTVLAARVRAVPEAGAANTALVELVARAAGVPKRDVAVISGSTARLKTVRVAGEPDTLAARLTAALARPA
jgi:uncharacterized protein YggU (UPF0235/DUF167 family)